MSSKGNSSPGGRGQPSDRQWTNAASKSPDDFPEEENREAETRQRDKNAKGGGSSAARRASSDEAPDSDGAPETTGGKGKPRG